MTWTHCSEMISRSQSRTETCDRTETRRSGWRVCLAAHVSRHVKIHFRRHVPRRRHPARVGYQASAPLFEMQADSSWNDKISDCRYIFAKPIICNQALRLPWLRWHKVILKFNNLWISCRKMNNLSPLWYSEYCVALMHDDYCYTRLTNCSARIGNWKVLMNKSIPLTTT